MKLAAIALLMLIVAGCAVGNQHVYHEGSAELAPSGGRALAVATQDLRPYVTSGDKAPNFVGLSRGGFGNPFDVTTASGNALAQDFSATIGRSLEAKGYKTTAVSVTGAPPANVKELIAKAGKEGLALVTINEWKSDTMMNTALLYDLTVRVYDANGAQLAENRIGGKEDLGGSAINPPGHAKEAVPVAYRRKLEQLFNNDAVRQSLR
ncbi:MAG: hypothetical protein ABR570_12310 [Burkholderiales bacterium]